MHYTNKYFESAKCWEIFKNRCHDKDMVRFVDLFYSMHLSCDTHGEAKGNRLEIRVGRQQKDGFLTYLSSGTSNFIVKISKWEDEPQLILEDRTERIPMTMVVLNLNEVKNLHVDECRMVNCVRYDMTFNYQDGLDYFVQVKIRHE